MAREAATRMDAETNLLVRVPSLLASPAAGAESTLNRILAQATGINRIITPSVRKDHFEFMSPVGDARILLLEDSGPGGKGPRTNLVNVTLTPRTMDGFEAPCLSISYDGPYGMAGYFDGTNTGMTITAYDGTRQASAILAIDLGGSVPAMKQHSHRLEKSEPVTPTGPEQNIVLHGEGKDVLNVTAYDDLTLCGVEGLDRTDGFFAFSIMGKNSTGEVQPIPIVIPKRVTVC